MSDSWAEQGRVPPSGIASRAPISDCLGDLEEPRGAGARNGAALTAAAERAAQYARSSRAAGTMRVYTSDWNCFVAWCDQAGLQPLPAATQTIALYLASQAGRLAVATLKRHLAAIVFVHKRVGHPVDRRDPVLADVWSGICRRHGTPPARKTALSVDDLRRMLELLPTGLAGKRDRALLLLGFAAALRRSELVALDRDDVEFRREGAVITLRRSKGDQLGRGALKGVPYGTSPATCPVAALKEWSVAARLDSDDPLFMPIDRFGRLDRRRLSAGAVALVVKRSVERWGRAEGLREAALKALVASVSGHSLRSGYATAAAAADLPEWAIAAQTGHRDRASLEHYIRSGELFKSGQLKGGIGL